jgi:tetratricopeptide (TPR) repeat protein/DNA-binding XRE family transcriptional regulator
VGRDGATAGAAFGQVLRRFRQASGLSQEELAERAGVGVRTIRDLELARTSRPYRQTIRSLADALGLQGQRLDEFVRWSREGRGVAPADAPAGPDGIEVRTVLGTTAGHTGTVVPRQLPASARHFAGRSGELAVLSGLLDPAAGAGPAVVISAIGGLAGIGKTALALQWAHQVADRFPDGQLYVNLRGYDPALPPLPPAQAIRWFLDALEVPAARIPADLEAQVGLYRSLLADRRVLIVADNAADAAQVRPLLPGSPGCLAIVTSRSQLTGLVATDGAIPISLDVLTYDEARDLLARFLGEARIAAEPQAASQLIELCGRLPLALTITAARAASGPRLPLERLAAELAGAAGRLDALHTADEPLASVRAALDCSYQQLSVASARVLRLLGVHPGPHISAPATASLAGLTGPQAAWLLAELADASLVGKDDAGRYSMHDLVRLYAAEQVSLADSDAERRAATNRMLDHYLHTGHIAARLVSPATDPITVGPPSPGAAPEHLPDYQAAMSWFETEHRVLVAALGLAFAAGQDTRAWKIAWTLNYYFILGGHWHDQVAVQTAALAAAVRLGDLTLRARSHLHLAQAAIRLNCYSDAESHFRHALDLYRQTDEPAWPARAHLGLARLLNLQGQHADAADRARRALDLFTAAGHELGQADALNNLGWFLSELGDHKQALAHCQQALALCRKNGGRQSEAHTLDSIGYAHHHLGQHAEGIACFQQALGIARETGYRYQQAAVLAHLGDTYDAAGDLQAARAAWREALGILDDLQHPDSEQVRTKLEAPPRPVARPHPSGQVNKL